MPGDDAPAPRKKGISRRRFLRRTLLGGALLAIGATVGKHVTGYSLAKDVAGRLKVLSPKEYLILQAICRRILAGDEPGAPSPDEIGAAEKADAYLAFIDESLTSDIRALLHLVEHSAWLSAGRPARFTRMQPAKQDEVLAAWESSSLDVRRQGFAALKSLAMIGYYDDPRTFPILGYPGPLLDAGKKAG